MVFLEFAAIQFGFSFSPDVLMFDFISKETVMIYITRTLSTTVRFKSLISIAELSRTKRILSGDKKVNKKKENATPISFTIKTNSSVKVTW